MARCPSGSLEAKQAWMRQRMAKRGAEEAAQESARADRAADRDRTERAGLHRSQHRPAPLDEMLRVDEVARHLKVSRRSVQRWFRDRAIYAGEGPCRRVMLITRRDLDAWKAEHHAIAH